MEGNCMYSWVLNLFSQATDTSNSHLGWCLAADFTMWVFLLLQDTEDGLISYTGSIRQLLLSFVSPFRARFRLTYILLTLFLRDRLNSRLVLRTMGEEIIISSWQVQLEEVLSVAGQSDTEVLRLTGKLQGVKDNVECY